MDFRIETYEELKSTNEVVRRRLREGVPEGLVVTARRQTAGRGRMGRVWESPAGGLYFSVGLRPQVSSEQLGSLSLVTAIAMARVLREFVSPANRALIRIKWPNDIVWGPASEPFHKLCGISLDGSADGVCVGIGVNVIAPAGRPEVLGKNLPIYLGDLGFQDTDVDHACNKILQAVLSAFSPLYESWRSEGFTSFVSAYQDLSLLDGELVQVHNERGGLTAQGHVVGINENGCLLIEAANGTLNAISSGEVSLLK